MLHLHNRRQQAERRPPLTTLPVPNHNERHCVVILTSNLRNPCRSRFGRLKTPWAGTAGGAKARMKTSCFLAGQSLSVHTITIYGGPGETSVHFCTGHSPAPHASLPLYRTTWLSGTLTLARCSSSSIPVCRSLHLSASLSKALLGT